MKIVITEKQFGEIILSEGKVKSHERGKIYEDNDWLVVIPLTHNASCKYGAYSKWCVAVKGTDQHFKRYMRNGILFYILNKNKMNEKYSYFHSSIKNSDSELSELYYYSKFSGWYDIDDNNESGVPVKGENPFNLPNGIITAIKNNINTYKKDFNNYNSMGEKDGYWEEYWLNEQLASKGNYVDGKREGYWESYHSNGKLYSKGNYVDGKMEGYWEIYYDNGLLHSKGRYINNVFNKI